MTFLLTAALTFLIVILALGVFWKLGSPVYRVERVNIIRLLEMVTTGQATESDWHVFSAYTIRHDPALAETQQRCLLIAESEFVGGKDWLFTAGGLKQLKQILEDLKIQEKEDAHD